MSNYFNQDQYAPMQSNITCELKRGFFVAQPAENALNYRPIVMTFNQDISNRLQNITEGGLNINHAALSEIARDIISPSAQSRGIIGINGGWDEQRFAVFLEFETRTPTAVITEVITGYTDHLGFSDARGANQACFNPAMFIHVNSHMRINYQQTYGANGSIIVPRAANPNQILRPITVQNGQSNIQSDAAIAMRPTDCLLGVQRNLMGGAAKLSDPRSVLDPNIHELGVASSRTNEIPSRYLETVFKSFSQAHNNGEGYDRETWTYGTAASYAKEAMLDTSVLLQRLGSNTGYATTGCFTMGEMLRMWPYAEDVIEVVMPSQGAITSMKDVAQGWGGYSDETQIGHALAHAVPAALTQSLLVGAEFTATNMTLDGSIAVGLPNAQMMFPSPNDQIMANGFIESLRNSILPEILARHGSFDITMGCNLFGTSTITISLDGYPAETFSAPNYCDALSAATIASDENEIQMQAINTKGLIESTFTNQSSLGILTK